MGNRSNTTAIRSISTQVIPVLAERFQEGVEYPEPDVNELLGRFHEDYASLRRHLVDDGLLTRSAGHYRRA